MTKPSLCLISWGTSSINGTARSETLDWFRGIGILGVLWGHAGLPGLPGAYLFIDTFFVISGFLVCQSFLRVYDKAGQDQSGHPVRLSSRMFRTISTFYGSRIRRIVIPLGAAVLITLVAGWFILLPDDLVALARSAQATLLLQAHLYALMLGNYFDALGGTAPLLHAWSLSLEEWFYIVTPVLVIPALIWRRYLWLAFLILLTGFSLYTAQSMSSDPNAFGASYSMFDTRLWEFLIGVVAALIFARSPDLPKVANDVFLVGGIALVFASVLLLNSKAASPGLITLPAVIGTLVLLVLRPRTQLVRKATRSGFVAFFGRRLYSLYLAHYPFMVLFDYVGIQLGAVTDLAKFALAIVFSLVFYRTFEAPMQGWRSARLLHVILMSGALFGLALGLASHIQKTDGAGDRMPSGALAAWAARFDINPMRAECLKGNLTRFGYSCATGADDEPYMAVMGDSHSDSLANQLAHAFGVRGLGMRHYWYAECPVIGSGVGRLGVFSPECAKLSHEAHAATLHDGNLAGVVYVLRWSWYLNDPDKDRIRAYWRDAAGLPRGHDSMGAFRQEFTHTLAASISAYQARGVPVYLVSPVPEVSDDPVKAQALAQWLGFTAGFETLRHGVKIAVYQAERAYFDALVSDLQREVTFEVFDVKGVLCGQGRCEVYGPNGSLYYDTNHLNEAGAQRIMRGLLER